MLLCNLVAVLGLIRIKQPMVLAYICVGVLFGALEMDLMNALTMRYISEFAMIFLLFIIGIELDMGILRKNWLKTTVCFTVQVSLIALSVTALAWVCEWSLPFAVFIFSNLMLSSTAIIISLLDNLNILHGNTGSLVMSLLILQDLSIAPVILLLQNINSASMLQITFKMMIAILLLVAAIIYFGRPVERGRFAVRYRRLLARPEVTALLGITVCFVAVSFADFCQFSASYGAFLSGLFLGHILDRESLSDTFTPLNNMMMLLFFISIGARLPVKFLVKYINVIGMILLAITVIKVVANMISLKMIGRNFRGSIFTAVLLSQISEFSLMLIDTAVESSIISRASVEFYVTIVILSLILGSILPVIVKYIVNKTSSKPEKLKHMHVN